jgi:23S rRNA (cytosine1962-C5)-methyltransferase
MPIIPLEECLDRAINLRITTLDEGHQSAVRLFAGFYEGHPDLVVDLYGRTLVLFNFCEGQQQGRELLEKAQQMLLERLQWVTSVIQKTRFTEDPDARRGRITFGESPDSTIEENGIRYVLDLTMNQDASFYLDTRNLRTWLQAHSRGLEVFNTFAYTGSLGVAALAGGAAKVVQVDRNAKYLSLARSSAMLNHLDLGKMKLRTEDFFSDIGKLKREGRAFDLVLLDPPFFSVSDRGRVDQVAESNRLVNKVRPLVKDGGRIIAVNNALFLPGKNYIDGLNELCKDGYLTIEEIIPIPEDITGFPETVVSPGPVDPAPFNHSTKIVVLRVKRTIASKKE